LFAENIVKKDEFDLFILEFKVSAPKLKWPQTTSSCTSETIHTPDGGVAQVRNETVQSSFNSGPVYSGNTVTNTYSSTFSNSQQIQQLSNKLDSAARLTNSRTSFIRNVRN
jgi:hypothetical protein